MLISERRSTMAPLSTSVSLITMAALSLTPYTSALVPAPVPSQVTVISTSTSIDTTTTKKFPVMPSPLPNSTVIIPVTDEPAGAGASTPNATTLRIVDDDPVYKYVGCWTDTSEFPGASHALDGPAQTLATAMTVGRCIKFCSSAKKPGGKGNVKGGGSSTGWPVAALEHSRDCYCGSAVGRRSFNLKDSVCDAPCAGSNTTACGGNLALSVYNATAEEEKKPADGPPPLPETPHGSDGKHDSDGNGGNGDDDKKDEAVLQAVGMGVLVVALSVAVGVGLF
ncbi:hypothetical protein GGR53DRAFT_481606 [Hypoxylon sp. FL1150]|nr:hypothetical protein GGR53DRAFT_481606 [Hypoxylon sp. FL1150]